MRKDNINQTPKIYNIRKLQWIWVLVLMTLFMNSCGIIEGIFQAGMGLGILIAVAVVALVIYIIAKISRKK
jgi:amino acid transporter